MEQRFLGQIKPDMDVCDINGDKIGTVADVLRHEFARASAQGAIGDMGQSRPADVIEVKTGFLGLGRRLYIPMEAVQDVTVGCVFVSKMRDEVNSQGWETKPDFIP